MNELLDFARELGRQAGQQLLSWRGRVDAAVKRDGSLITVADQSVDRFLNERITERYPDHAVLSEEGNTTFSGQHTTWVIDPLDGTNNFALGLAYWGCSIAVVQEGYPVVAVLVVPVLEMEFWAAKDSGAFLNGKRLKGPAPKFPDNNSMLAICSRTCRYLQVNMPQKIRLLGSAAYDLAAVAQGMAVGCFQVRSHIWDLAAGWLLLKEAGRSVGSMLPNVPEPFPMVPGTDYADRVFPLVAAVDESMFNKFKSRVSVKKEAQERLASWFNYD
jgi:myo-inositol-1(or 4)-monophosphatase